MVAAQHKLSRRALLAGACALPLTRHSGLDPESMSTAATPAPAAVFMDPGLRRDDAGGRDDEKCRIDGKWAKALARFAQAEAVLEALAHTEDDNLYGRALGRHGAALARLLRAPAPDLGAVAGKLDLIVRRHVSELAFGEASMAALRRDVLRLAGPRLIRG
jgi:hypothetical protein